MKFRLWNPFSKGKLVDDRHIQDQIAFRIRAELVCCDIYDIIQAEARKLQEFDLCGDKTPHANAIGRAVNRGDWHDICYWAEASAQIAEGRCPGYETEPNICRCACEGCKHSCRAHQSNFRFQSLS